MSTSRLNHTVSSFLQPAPAEGGNYGMISAVIDPAFMALTWFPSSPMRHVYILEEQPDVD
jgi:hypothetical protein